MALTSQEYQDTFEQELLVREAKPTGTNDALGWFLSPG